MAQSLEYLLYKHGDLNSDLQNPSKLASMERGILSVSSGVNTEHPSESQEQSHSLQLERNARSPSKASYEEPRVLWLWEPIACMPAASGS